MKTGNSCEKTGCGSLLSASGRNGAGEKPGASVPVPGGGEKPVEERNSHSLVFDVTYGKFRMFLTGDIGVEDERKILAVEEDKRKK